MTAILLVIGVMDPRVMAVIMAAITVERLAPSSERVASHRAFVIWAGLFLIGRAAGLGRCIPQRRTGWVRPTQHGAIHDSLYKCVQFRTARRVLDG